MVKPQCHVSLWLSREPLYHVFWVCSNCNCFLLSFNIIGNEINFSFLTLTHLEPWSPEKPFNPYASCWEEREPLKLTLLWLFHKFGFLKKQKFYRMILSISWSLKKIWFFPRTKFYIFLRRLPTVKCGSPRLSISCWWNHIWNIFGTNFPPNHSKIFQSHHVKHIKS